MGQTLSSPATKKYSQSGENSRFYYGVSEMQGWRISMEDAHATVLDLDEGKEDSNAFFAVYDGHGGGTVAKFAGQHLHKRLAEEEAYKQRQYDVALKRAFLGTDEDLLANPAHTRDPSGCTAVAALVTTDGKIYVANAGDSRSVIGTKGEVKPLSFDHKPTSEVEKERIHGAGGYIEYGRVNGNLALSRALGDFEFKKNYSLSPEKQIITADPDVTCHEITEEDEFLVLACDGIWDCLSSQQAVDFVRRQVAEGKELTEICENICEHCLAPDTSSGAGIGCDNMTVMIIAILHGRTKAEWYNWVTDRVNNNYGYSTPASPPQLYAQSRLMSFRARREAQERNRQASPDDEVPSFLGGPLARVLAANGGISFMHSTGISSDGGALMFSGNDDSDDDDSEEEVSGRSFFTETLGLGRPESPDPTQRIKAQLDALEKDIREEDGTIDDDDDARMDETPDDNSTNDTSHPPLEGEIPSSTPLPNGEVSMPEQLSSPPLGDEPHAVVQAEGLLDSSEDPLLKA
ncbi:putative serine/threonine phosphatases, family 2C, catalytic domain [Lyophyllum shimeji]|uniref:protein-serine/threonine phosphatase n=1 Tax=Lyophyllum shimeji TaxID=47721 RepID=A0A9P3PLB3_LYOSH|nr:putative serine/threonine phosphatases, family 2C, catalytic domain [Lyophyllum shimeji]